MPQGFFIEGKMKEKEVLHKIVSFIDRKELDFLDQICKDIYFSKSIRISRSAVLRESIDIFMEDKTSGIKNYRDLIDVFVKKFAEKTE